MIITIARQCGCNAFHIGEILSQKLGLTLYTRQMLLDKARLMGLGNEMEPFFNESPVDDILMAISDRNEAQDELKKRFKRLFNTIIGNESCIVTGRCGNSIFADRSDLVSVFLSGELSERIAATAASHGINEAQARELVSDTDDHRSLYHKYYTGLTWGNAQDYDLCINALRLGAEASAQIIAQYAQQVCPAKQ